jgi:hypothetical protein
VLSSGHVRFVQTDQFNVYLDIGRRFDDLRSESNLFITLFIYQLLLGVIAAAAAGVLAITCIGPVLVGTLAFLANGYILGTAAVAARRTPQAATR